MSIQNKILQYAITTLILVVMLHVAIVETCQSDETRVITIVSYNTKNHESWESVSWQRRFDNFVDDVIIPYRPAIIGLQELYLHGKNSWASGKVADVGRGEYLRYVLNRIHDRLGKRYYVATTLRVHYAWYGIAEEWQGNGVIYDPDQVRFIPFNEDNGQGRECANWAQDRLQESRNDCLPLSGKGSPKVSKSLFEFPKDSNNYILFYNIHCNVESNKNYKQIREAVDFILNRHQHFLYNKYPPIFVGDFNRKTHPKFEFYFDDPIGEEHIDKMLLGKSYRWLFDSESSRDAPRRGPAWIVIDKQVVNERVYSDHPVVLVQLEAPMLEPTLIEDCIPFNPNNAIIHFDNGGYHIVQGNKKLYSFGYAPREAQLTLQIIKHYNLSQTCYVGRPNPSFQYLLSAGRAPTGSIDNEDCLYFSPSNLVVTKVAGHWKIRDGTLQLMDFGDQYHEASKVLAIIKHYGFTYRCFVGRPNPSFKYLRK